MQYITTTELRTRSKELIKALCGGQAVGIIHRSRMVGKIQPSQESRPLTKEDIAQLKKLAKGLNLPKLSYKERERRYRKHLMKKYGQGLS